MAKKSRNKTASSKGKKTRAVASRRRQATAEALSMSAVELAAMRDVFWSNVAREMLSGLSVLSQQQPQLFDGRFAVLTRGGERIPIARIEPVFACSMPFDADDKRLSIAVQSTVFRVQTPAGEVFTLPLHEVRALHALTPELISKMQAALGEQGSSAEGAENGAAQPFGLAAFAALPKRPISPPPGDPTE